MKTLFITLIVTVFSVVHGISQSALLQNEIELNKKEALNEGYTLLDSGGFETNYDWMMTFDPDQYYGGCIYYVVIYLEGHSNCDLRLIFQRSDNGAVDELEPTIKRAGGIVRAIYGVKQTKTSYGKIGAYAKSRNKVYTYGLLFRKFY